MERQVQTGMAEYTAAQRVALARNTARPGVVDYVQGLFTDFFEQKGDRLCGEDPSIFGGIGLFHGRPVSACPTPRDTARPDGSWTRRRSLAAR